MLFFKLSLPWYENIKQKGPQKRKAKVVVLTEINKRISLSKTLSMHSYADTREYYKVDILWSLWSSKTAMHGVGVLMSLKRRGCAQRKSS